MTADPLRPLIAVLSREQARTGGPSKALPELQHAHDAFIDLARGEAKL